MNFTKNETVLTIEAGTVELPIYGQAVYGRQMLSPDYYGQTTTGAVEMPLLAVKAGLGDAFYAVWNKDEYFPLGRGERTDASALFAEQAVPKADREVAFQADGNLYANEN